MAGFDPLHVFIMFFEGVFVRLDEILRFDEVHPEPERRDIPTGTQTKVYTRHTGFFYTAEPLDGILERILEQTKAALS